MVDLGRGSQIILLFGKGGWIAGLLGNLLTQQGHNFKFADSRMENRDAVARFVCCSCLMAWPSLACVLC